MKKWRTELKRLFVVLLTAALVGNTIDFSALTVSAETAGQTEESSAVIVSFGELSEEVREQLLPVGANESDIIFPDTLTVTVEKTAPEEETGTGEDESTVSEPEEDITTKSEPEQSTDTEETTDDGEDTEEPEQITGDSEETEDDSEPQTEPSSEEDNLIGKIADVLLPEPLIVYAAEGENETVSGGDAGEGTDGQIITEDITLENITWELDADNSDSDTFLSDESANGSFYTYVPVLPETVTLTDSEGEVCDFTLTLDKNVYLPEIYVLVGDSGIATFSADGYYDENGFCTDYELKDGSWVLKNALESCSHGGDCNGYQPATLTNDKYDIDDNGTKDNVYEIGNAGQLYWFAGLVNGTLSGVDWDMYANANAVLTADITVNTGVLDENGDLNTGAFRSWTPIGGYYNTTVIYNGIFDGNNNTISGLYYDESSESSSEVYFYVGLFGTNGGTIKNVGIVDSYFGLDSSSSGYQFFVGGLCGVNNSTIENCDNEATVTVKGTGNTNASVLVGGVCGNNNSRAGIIKNCKNAGKVSSTVSNGDILSVGGVCGYNCYGDTIENCYNEGKVNGTKNVGGVCGYNYAGDGGTATITNCYNTNTVSGTDYVGGVCGYNDAGDVGDVGTATITNCYNTNIVSGTKNVGGVCGYNDAGDGGTATITNCYNTNTVSGTNYVGGVCGYNYAKDGGTATITNCYNINTVSGKSNCKGVCGYNYVTATIKNCYYLDTTVSDSKATAKTATQFANGAVAYLLSKGCTIKDITYEGSAWKQNIDNVAKDAYPLLDQNHGTVYISAPCPSSFSNMDNLAAVAHIFEKVDDENHKCKNCGLETVHSTATLTYTADEATDKITVKCGDDCGKEYGTVTLSAPTEDLTYDGNAKTASVSNNVTEVTISNPTITYKQGGNTLPSAPTDAGTYTASITLGTGEDAATVSVEFTIEKATPELGTVSVTTLNNTLNTSEVEFSRTDTSVSGTFALTGVTKLQYGTHDYSYVFTPTGDDAINYKPVEGTVSITVNDTIAPTAEYQIGENGWKKFVNTIFFGLFCKDYKTVEIKYSDVNASNEPGSGVKTEQYYIANEELTEDEVADLQWKNYSDTISLNAEGVYFIYVKVEDNAGNSVVLNSEGIVIYAESTLSPTSMDYTYKENKDLEVQITLNGNTFVKLTDGEGTEIATSNYEIDASGKLTLKKAYLDTLDVGQYTYKVSMNPQGQTTDAVTLTYSFVVNVKAQELTVTGATATSRVYDTTKAVAITAVELSGIRSGEVVSVDTTNLTGTLTGANAGSYTSVNLPALTLTGADAGNYRLVQPTDAVSTTVTISKADAQITVDTGKDSYSKTFGDVAFPLSGISDTNTEANVQYAVTEGEDVVSVSNGTVTIKKAGAAKITVSLPASTNYNAAEDKTITVTVAKNGNYSVEEVNRSYLYSRNNTENIDLSGYLPADCGNVTYGELLKNGDLYTDGGQPTVSDDGKLSYTVKQAETSGATGTIQVTVTTENYADFTITVNVKLTDKLLVKLKDGSSVTLQNSTLTYGQALSTLSFNSAEFVDDGGKVVTGNLAWKTPDGKPKVGTTSATWVFTPEDEAYEAVEDTVGITVNKATPNVTALPTVAERTYHPTVSLTDTDLVGGTVNVAGSWNWQKANLIPTVNNSGYVAVFTPEDSTNYETVTRAITVTVTKATPYIKTAPTAAAITYGDTLGASMLSSGTVQYSASDETTIAGSFTWKDSSVKPSVSDSGTTAYRIVFNPSDAENYNTAETGITLTVNKAENAPNMPSSTMNVANSCTKVSDVTLPTGWVWQDADQNTALTVDTPVTVTAVYNGADAGNYVKKTVSVTITRSALNNGGGSSSGGSSGGGNNGGGSSSGGSSSGGNTGGNGSSGGSSSGGTEAGTGDQPENSGNTTTITNGDGSTTTTKTETDTNGNTITTSTTVAADGSSTEKVQATETNTAGKEVAVTTTTKTDADGNVTSVTEKSVIADITKDTTATITVKTGGDGKVTSAKASITKTSDSTKVSLSGKVLDQITEAAGADVNVRVSMTVKDNDGKTKYTVQADVNEVIPGKKLYIYKLDTKTGKYTMVDDKKYEVTKAGTVTVNMTKKATYELVTAEESKVITKEILATVKPAKKSKSLPVKNTTTFKLSDMLDMDNIKRITYATSKKSVATITKKGTIKAVKAGTATVKATVTLKNGTKKTIKMTIKVK